MLQEINFVYLIEQFKFKDIEIIDIKLLKETFEEQKINKQNMMQSFAVGALEKASDPLKIIAQEQEENRLKK